MNHFAKLIILNCCIFCNNCGLTVTNKATPPEELDEVHKSAIEIILEELTILNEEINARVGLNINEILNIKNIHTDFEGLIFAGNLADGLVHISLWENLTDKQHELVQGWFQLETLEETEKAYNTLFYKFLVVSQGMKQYIYNTLSGEWVYDNMSIFSVEQHSIRATLSFFRETDRQYEMWPFMEKTCRPMLDQYNHLYEENFNQVYLLDNIHSLLGNLEDPTGYIWFICAWTRVGAGHSVNFTKELTWLADTIERRKRHGEKDDE